MAEITLNNSFKAVEIYKSALDIKASVNEMNEDDYTYLDNQPFSGRKKNAQKQIKPYFGNKSH
jgi:hypothetical protein